MIEIFTKVVIYFEFTPLYNRIFNNNYISDFLIDTNKERLMKIEKH